MQRDYVFKRRDFIRDSALGVASFFLWGCSAPKSPFGDSQRSCLISMAERIIPRDEFAGATDAGVINYIENWVSIYYPERLPYYNQSIARFQSACAASKSKEFQDIDAAEQDELLKTLQAGNLPTPDWSRQEQKAFFNEIRDRTMQGFYGNPRHGGNKNFVSYRMMKLDSPLVIGQNRYASK